MSEQKGDECMISVETFLDCVNENAGRITHYEPGGDGSDGGCDCIGLIIGALRLAGEKWKGTHGSNWAARNALQEPWPFRVGEEWELFPGAVIFKAKEPGESGYDLPDVYKNSSDKRDYYHVGVVINVSPLCIMHCTSSGDVDGIKTDTTLGKWAFYGRLKQVDYEGGHVEPLYHARVFADNGYPVNLRSDPTLKATILTKVPVDRVVDVLEETDAEWAKVKYVNYTGYMMRKFLRPIYNEAQPPSENQQNQGNEPSYGDETPDDVREKLMILRSQLEQSVQLIDSLIGDGNVG